MRPGAFIGLAFLGLAALASIAALAARPGAGPAVGWLILGAAAVLVPTGALILVASGGRA